MPDDRGGPVAASLAGAYSDFYRARGRARVYPVEFVVRAFLAAYPRLSLDKSAYGGQRILDLGFGDGRNMPLLYDLGMEVHGVEISEEICTLAHARMAALEMPVTVRVGRNRKIPYGDGFFGYVLACHSCYYVDPGARFEDTVWEVARILAPSGIFVFSVPMGSSYLMKDAEDLGDGHMRIKSDPFGVRNGSVLKKFDSESDLRTSLAPAFADISIGSCRNDFWGIEEHVWIVACSKPA